MAKNFNELRKKMSVDAQQLAHEKAQTELARLNTSFEPDVIEWLQQQNAQTKHYINEMVRAVMKMQLQAQN